jgi:hypothetical protein
MRAMGGGYRLRRAAVQEMDRGIREVVGQGRMGLEGSRGRGEKDGRRLLFPFPSPDVVRILFSFLFLPLIGRRAMHDLMIMPGSWMLKSTLSRFFLFLRQLHDFY